MPSVAVIIPAFNEEKSIKNVVESINHLETPKNFKIVAVVVNDCSTDGTSKIIEQLNCIALNLPSNLGIGGAVQTGYIYAYKNNFDYAMQLDGDGQHPPKEIIKFLNYLQSENAPADVIIGSRYIDKIGFQSTFMRRMGINYFKFLIKLLVNIKITDSTSGFRMINIKTLALVHKNYPDEYPEPESIILYHKNKLTIAEIPVVMEHRASGTSSISTFGSFYYMLKVTLAMLFSYIKK